MQTYSLKVRVARKTVEALDISSFELVHVDGDTLPPFSAGAHIDVQIREGLTRQYSLCNDPRESHRYLIAVLRDPKSRGGSIAMHDEIREGDIVHISGPKNHFPLAHEVKRSLLIAGGIGVTPILCMAERLSNIGADFEMRYCARSTDRMAFMSRIRDSRFASSVTFHFDDGPAEQALNLNSVLDEQGRDAHLYVCGPSGFIKFVTDTARKRGWCDNRIHLEYFGAEMIPRASDDSFEVEVASSGRVLLVPQNKTVAAILLEHGIEVATSCEQGVCGTCLTRVLEGTPDHRDCFLTDEEHAKNDQFTPCCSRSKSNRLVLDL